MRLSLLFFLVACSDSPSNSDPTTDGATTETDGPGEPATPACYRGCTTVADCTRSGSLYDEDNYVCDDGACVYTGCNNDDECATLGDEETFVCVDDPGASGRSCEQICSTVADCAGRTPSTDEDNYTCEDQVCRYQGCNNDDECLEGLGEGYVCAPGGILGVPMCSLACSTVDDCILESPSLVRDEDNYACEDGACLYLGCNNDAECEDVWDAGAQCR